MARVTKEESDRVRLAILNATTSELAEHGYHGLRVPAVARRIGKTQGAVYGRFPDKESLVVACVRHVRDELFVPKVVLAVSQAKTPQESFEAVSQSVAELAEQHPDGQLMFARLASELAGNTGPAADEIRSLFEMFVMTFKGLIMQGKNEGVLHDDIDPEVFAYAVVGMPVMHSTIATMFGKEVSYAALEAQLRSVLTRGISKGDDAPKKKRTKAKKA